MSSGIYRSTFKRPLDCVAAASALVLLSPVLALCWVAIKLDDGGPAIFRQQRVGRDKASFTIYKFRSMPTGTSDLPSVAAGALRITRVGTFLRRSNLDELPQLWNILVGDMSLVGPRPALASQLELIRLRDERGTFSVRPGLTGLAQVSSFDGMSELEKATLDAEYAANITLLVDSVLVLRTIGYLFKPPPVY